MPAETLTLKVRCRSQSSRLFLKLLLGLLLIVILILVVLFRDSIWANVSFYYHLLSDRDKVRDFITSFGLGAPLVFMGIQILQVIFAPCSRRSHRFYWWLSIWRSSRIYLLQRVFGHRVLDKFFDRPISGGALCSQDDTGG